ncbi:hybrid sensor histidine kinase/response regulator [Roseateles sp. BYS87W]|uniref:histidine kinase n=1 Tax=Pelomonas baiyunensis TaxID=3299026 RepID=A0ABW7GV20_9BURK
MFALLFALVLAVSGAHAQAPGARSVDAVDWQAADGAWQAVALPDDWRLRGVPRPGQGRYRVQLTWAEADGAGDWALWSARFPLHHRVWLNGTVVSDLLEVPDAFQPRTTPWLVRLPRQLLRPGANEVLIEEKGGLRAGLGVLHAGPVADVELKALWYRRMAVDLSRTLNGLAGGAALFALLLWARRRHEVTLGWYGALALLLALRNIAFVEPGAPSPAGAGQGMYLLIVAVNALYGFFGVSLGAPGWRAWRVWLVVVAVAATIAGLVWPGDAASLDRLRQWVYPLLTANATVATALLGRAAWRQRRRGFWLLALLGLALLAGGTYDMLLQGGRLPQHWEFVLPWLGPLLVLIYGGMLGGRLVQALADSERAGQVLEQRVRERTAALEAANTAKTRFLAAASHDLRQPMVTIGVLVGVLREQLVSPAQQRLIGRVDEAVAAMEGLLAGLLDLSRLDAAGLRVAREPVNLRVLLEALAAHEREAAVQRGLRLRVRVPAEATVLGDAVLIEQVLRNLVGNALRYTERGGVLVGVRRRGAHWRVAVWDTGRGIPAAEQARVFEDFVQLDNPQRDRSRGLGLGLAIVRRATGLLGAEILLRSTPGRGSCFALDLPAVDAAAAPRAESAPPPGPALSGRTVCLVEDDDGAREALRLRLQAWGGEVVALASPAELREGLAEGRWPAFDLLVTDMRLPGGSGLDVVAALRAAQGPVPAVIVTGNTAPEDLAELGASGLPVVHKPFRAEQLAQALRPLVNGPV